MLISLKTRLVIWGKRIAMDAMNQVLTFFALENEIITKKVSYEI
jgi:hypothetical protein